MRKFIVILLALSISILMTACACLVPDFIGVYTKPDRDEFGIVFQWYLGRDEDYIYTNSLSEVDTNQVAVEVQKD